MLHIHLHAASTYGQDFYIGFMRSTGGSPLVIPRLIVSTPSASTAFVVETMSEIAYQGTVTSGSPIVITLSAELQVTGSDFSNREKGIHIYTNGTEPLFVLTETVLANINYGTYIAYPCQIHETLTSYKYTVLSHDSPSPALQSTFLLVGCEDNTSVTITPSQIVTLPADAQKASSSISVNPNVQSHKLTLNKIQTLLVFSDNDLTGTVITADKPLTVVSGHECVNVPLMESGCEPLAIQLPLTSTWGTNFILAPFDGRNSAQRFKAVTSKNNTTIAYTCDNTSVTITNVSIFFELSTDKYCYLESSNPILLAELSVGQTLDSLGDPAIAMISPIDQYIQEVQFVSLPNTHFPNSYISITVPTEHYSPNGIFLNGEIITCQWQTIYNRSSIAVGYGCSMAVSSEANTPAQHTISHIRPGGLFSVLVYGFNTFPYQGYAYLTGQHITLPGKLLIFFSVIRKIQQRVRQAVCNHCHHNTVG